MGSGATADFLKRSANADWFPASYASSVLLRPPVPNLSDITGDQTRFSQLAFSFAGVLRHGDGWLSPIVNMGARAHNGTL